MNEELKPCPWCGCAPVIFCATISCHMCSVEMGGAYLKETIKVWNTRTPSPRELKLVEAIREYIAADDLVSRIYDEASPGLNTPRPKDHYTRLGEAIERRLTARAALSAYDAPGSQGGEQPAVYQIPLYDEEGKVTFQPVTHYPADEKAPIGEEELAELLHKEHNLWWDGKISDKTLNIFQHQSRALAKRLGWM